MAEVQARIAIGRSRLRNEYHLYQPPRKSICRPHIRWLHGLPKTRQCRLACEWREGVPSASLANDASLLPPACSCHCAGESHSRLHTTSLCSEGWQQGPWSARPKLVRGSDASWQAQHGFAKLKLNVSPTQLFAPLGNCSLAAQTWAKAAASREGSQSVDQEEVSVEGGGSEGDPHADPAAPVAQTPEALQGGLYLVGTPIGNLEDMSFRAIRILQQAALILAEDTRHSGKLLRHYGIRTPMLSYHQFNAAARLAALLERLQRGEALALISDAGMPAISDPGAHLVAACAERGVPVVPVPGPCAVVAAVAACGFPRSEFTFLGFLPDKVSARRQRLDEVAAERPSLVVYVAPHKLRTTLEDCAQALGPTRRCMLARELTKLHEELWRGTLEAAMAVFADRDPRGEMTLVIEGADLAEKSWGEEELEQRLEQHLAHGHSASEASRLVVLETSARRKQVYPLALKVAAQQNIREKAP